MNTSSQSKKVSYEEECTGKGCLWNEELRHFWCNQCNEWFTSKANLQQHLSQRIQCKVSGCRYISHTETRRRDHEFAHEVHLMCNVCGEKFELYTEIRKHRRMFHDNSGNDE